MLESLRPYRLYMLYSLYPFWKVFLFILNIFPFYYGNQNETRVLDLKTLNAQLLLKNRQNNSAMQIILFFLYVRNIKIVLMNNLCKINLSFSSQNQCKYKYFVLSGVFFSFLYFLNNFSFFWYQYKTHIQFSKFWMSCKLSCENEEKNLKS